MADQERDFEHAQKSQGSREGLWTSASVRRAASDGDDVVGERFG